VSPLRQGRRDHASTLRLTGWTRLTAARRALDAGNVDVVLPFVPEQGETEVKDGFKALSESASSVTKRERSRTGCSSKPSYRGGCTYIDLKPAGLSLMKSTGWQPGKDDRYRMPGAT
jgi:hypothetical protein